MSHRIAIVGPASDDEQLRAALAPLLEDPETRQIIYLGLDGAAQRVVGSWQQSGLTTEGFLDAAADLAAEGSPDRIAALLAQDAERRKLAVVRCLPEPPARAVEMFERWMLLAVHDKSVLDKDDIANARVILYGRAKQADIKRFGPRCFFTPGPLAAGLVGKLVLDDGGDLLIRVCQLDGTVQAEQVLPAKHAKFVVTS